MLNSDTLLSIRLVVFDFDGVFTDNMVYVDQKGEEAVRCWRSDGLGLERLRSIGIKVSIISTEMNPVVAVRAQKLKLICRQGVENKATAIIEVCKEFQVSPLHTMFVGNDINDIPAFQSVGIPVGVADSYPEIYPHIVFRTKKPGGFGAVREICDLVFNARNLDN